MCIHTLDGVAGLLESGGSFEPVGTLLGGDPHLAVSALLRPLRRSVAHNPENTKLKEGSRKNMHFLLFLNSNAFSLQGINFPEWILQLMLW